jgi:hypothetical protein
MKEVEVKEAKWTYWLGTANTYGLRHTDMTVIQRIPLMLDRAQLLLPSDEEHCIVDVCHTLSTKAYNQQLAWLPISWF